MYYMKTTNRGTFSTLGGIWAPKRRKLLDKSWSGLFQQEILANLPVDTLRSYYHEWNGRPTKELHSMLGMTILQQMHDLTDEQAIENFVSISNGITL